MSSDDYAWTTSLVFHDIVLSISWNNCPMMALIFPRVEHLVREYTRFAANTFCYFLDAFVFMFEVEKRQRRGEGVR